MVLVMHDDDIWDTEAADSYDTPGTGMFSPEVLEPAVNRLAELAAVARRSNSRLEPAAWPCRSARRALR